MTVNNENLTLEDVEYITKVVMKGYRDALDEAQKESERIAPYTAEIWKEMFGDMKPHDLASGMGMVIAVRNEFYRREENGEYDS